MILKMKKLFLEKRTKAILKLAPKTGTEGSHKK